MQNKLHWAIHGQTAAEVIVDLADHQKQNMGLSTWKDAPKGKIQKFDVSVAKNYLTENEMAQLTRLVNAYLDVAEDMALRKMPMTMQDWETRLNKFIEATDREILQDAGRVTAEIAKAHAQMPSVKFTSGTLCDLARLRAFLQYKNPIASKKAATTIIQSVQIVKQHPQID